MSWKKTDLERLKAASIADRLRKTQAPARAHERQLPLNQAVAELLDKGLK